MTTAPRAQPAIRRSRRRCRRCRRGSLEPLLGFDVEVRPDQRDRGADLRLGGEHVAKEHDGRADDDDPLDDVAHAVGHGVHPAEGVERELEGNSSIFNWRVHKKTTIRVQGAMQGRESDLDVLTSMSKDTDGCIKLRQYQLVLMTVQTLGITGRKRQTHLILARFGTKASVSCSQGKYRPVGIHGYKEKQA